MKARLKGWLIVAAFLLALSGLACGFNFNTLKATPTLLSTLPTATQPPASDRSGLVGEWLDPDTGTVTTIVAQGETYAVESVINPNRGVNELTQTNWSNGVLTWTYCPEGMHCIVSSTVSVDATTLVATWAWADGGYSGTTTFSRK